MSQRLSISPPASSAMIKVGNVKEYIVSENKSTGRPRKSAVLYAYKDLNYDVDGWADAKTCLPDDFDLVYLRLKREKTIPGWVSGAIWYGMRLKKDDEVMFWKRLEEDM